MGYIRHGSRIVLKGRYGAPATPPILINVESENEWLGAVARGGAAGLRRYDLGQFDASDLKEKKKRAIGPAFTPRFTDVGNTVADWTPKTSPQEKAIREEKLIELRAAKAELDAKEELNDAETEDLNDLKLQIAEFIPSGSGYLEEAPDAFGDGTGALYHSLGSDGVPSHYVWNRLLDEDQEHSLRLYFWRPREAANWQWVYEWGWWRLIFKDGNSAELIRLNEELAPTEREKLETELNALLDRGRVTVDDQVFIRERKEKIAAIKQKAQDEGRTRKEYTPDEKSGIKTAETEIEDRRKGKRGLTAADEKRAQELKKKIYRDSATVNFYQGSKDFFNQALTLTIIPDNRGYLTLVLGEQSWTYVDTHLRETGYRGTMWQASRPAVKCTGGTYKWQMGAPDFEKNPVLKLARRRLPFDPGNAVWTIAGDWDGQSDETQPLLFLVQVVEGSGGGGIGPEVDFSVVFHGDGTRGARLHRAVFYLPAGENEGDEDVFFDSDDHEDFIEDIDISYDEERDAQTLTVTFHNPDGVLPLDDVVGRMAEVWIEDEIDGEMQMVKVEGLGIVKKPETIKAAAPPTGSGPVERKANTRDRLVISDLYCLLDNYAVREQLPAGDGLYQSDYLRLCLSHRGVADGRMEGLEPGTGKVLGKTAKVVKGKTLIPLRDEPLFKPAENTMLGAWLRRISGLDDQRDLRLQSGDFSFPEIKGDENLAEFSSDDDTGRFQILEELALPDDTSETFNCFQVSGRKDPKTGERITLDRVVYESIHDPSDLRYIGFEKWFPEETDDALEDEEAVLERLDFLVNNHCLSVKMVKIESFFSTILRPKRKYGINGHPHRVKSISSASMARDRMSFVARRLAP